MGMVSTLRTTDGDGLHALPFTMSRVGYRPFS